MNKLTEHITLKRLLTVTLLAGAITAAILKVREEVKNVPAEAEKARQTLPKDGFERAGYKSIIPNHQK